MIMQSTNRGTCLDKNHQHFRLKQLRATSKFPREQITITKIHTKCHATSTGDIYTKYTPSVSPYLSVVSGGHIP